MSDKVTQTTKRRLVQFFNNWFPVILMAFMLTVIGLGIWWKVSVWHECWMRDSFWYCLHLIGSH